MPPSAAWRRGVLVSLPASAEVAKLKPSGRFAGALAALVLPGALLLLISTAFSEPILQEDFESGITGWVGSFSQPISWDSSQAHSGSHSLRLTVSSAGQKSTHRVVAVLPNSTYTLQGYVLKNDPAIERALLRIYWYSSANGTGEAIGGPISSLIELTTNDPSFQLLTTAPAVAPGGAHSARVGLWLVTAPSLGEGTAAVYLDDVTFATSDPTATPTPTPTPTRTPTATPSPSSTPTPSPTATATETPSPSSTLTPSPTPTATATPSSTPTPSLTPIATTTPTDLPSPSPTPTATPTATATPTGSPGPGPTPTATPTGTATPTASPSASPTATPSPTAAPTSPPTPSPTPTGELLQNGGFEAGVSNVPSLWNNYGGALAQSSSQKHSGAFSAALTSNSATAKWVYQTVPVSPGASYLLKGHVYNPNGAGTDVHLRLSWYATHDGTGEEIATIHPIVSPISNTPAWIELPLSGQAPASAGSARVKAMFVPASEAPATVYFDDLSLIKTADAPSPPPPLPAPPPGPAATPTSFATPRPPFTPTATPRPDRIVNDGLELATDGVPDGWETYGGKLVQVGFPVRSGRAAAALISTTTSTKWAYQTVSVSPGEGYIFSGYIYRNDPNVASVYLRLSWYASLDGSGRQLSYDDSLTTLDFAPKDNEERYRLLTTGAVAAPVSARSARARIMLDPVSSNYAIIYFDDVTFERTEVTPTPTPSPTPTASPTPTPSPSPSTTATPTPSASATPSSTRPPSPTATATFVPTPTATATRPPTPPAPIARIPAPPIAAQDTPTPHVDAVSPDEASLNSPPRTITRLPNTGDPFSPLVAAVGGASAALGLLATFWTLRRRVR